MSQSNFIIAFADGSGRPPVVVAALTEADLDFATCGMTEIVRLSDLTRYTGSRWTPLIRGTLLEGHDGREFHTLDESRKHSHARTT